MAAFFTSDLHLGHEKIIGFAKRPFSSVREMDEALIKNWNALIGDTDDVFILGDLSFYKPDETENLLFHLNGNKHLIEGNHDHNWLREGGKKKFNWVKIRHMVKLPDFDVLGGNQLIVLDHFPLLSWDRMHYGSWMLHGHCHGNMRYPFHGRILDVGVDAWDYKPVSYEQIKAAMSGKMDERKPEFLDHHKERYGES